MSQACAYDRRIHRGVERSITDEKRNAFFALVFCLGSTGVDGKQRLMCPLYNLLTEYSSSTNMFTFFKWDLRRAGE